MIIDTEFAFNRYEQIRERLPISKFNNSSIQLASLLDIKDEIDVFLFDAFGVLNVGESCIPGAPRVVAELQAMGKSTLVVTNAGSVDKSALLTKYRQLGYQFNSDQVVSSRDQLCMGLGDYPDTMRWGVAAPIWSSIDKIGSNLSLLDDDIASYTHVDGFIFLGSHEWNDKRQALMLKALGEAPRPVLVGNPDIIAPRENGFSLEPGFYAHDVADKTQIQPQFFGKPFAQVFDWVKFLDKSINPKRTIMIGDTLHTDILGGSAAGFKTALVTDHGLFKGHNAYDYIERSNIIPDYVLPAI